MFSAEYGDLEVYLLTQGGLYFRLTKVDDDLPHYNQWLPSVSVIPTCTTNFQVGMVEPNLDPCSVADPEGGAAGAPPPP